jgi:hypothetical protein
MDFFLPDVAGTTCPPVRWKVYGPAVAGRLWRGCRVAVALEGVVLVVVPAAVGGRR